MLRRKNICLLIFLIFISSAKLFATKPVEKKDKLTGILQGNDSGLKERLLVSYFKSYFQDTTISQIEAGKNSAYHLLERYNPANKDAFKYFVESLYQERLDNLKDAEINARNATDIAVKDNNHFLSYVFFSQLGSVQTERRDEINAVSSYWRAKMESVKLGDYRSEAALDVDISDLYYKNGGYNQSLFYLDDALRIIAEHKLDEDYLLTLIYYSKAESFFRMNNVDSLKVYNLKLKSSKNITYKIQTFRKRTDYYLQLLNHNYKGAIQLINSMMGGNKLYLYSALDKQHLADAYFRNGQTDSAKIVINQLLQEPLESNNPEIKFFLYQMLGAIAEKHYQIDSASYYYKLAINESQAYINNLTEVTNMSSQMKIEEIESAYLQKTQKYKKEQLILIFSLIVAALSIVVIYLFYRNVKQKRRYEQLLYKAERDELAFLNSHEVRKHLSNILGIINLIKQGNQHVDEFLDAQKYLYSSAEQLDQAIKNIADKLNEEVGGGDRN